MGAAAITQSRPQFGLLLRCLKLVLVLTSALVLALVISGEIFHLIPGITIAHSRGISMEPAYKEGDVVVLQLKRSPESVSIGDVVLFHEGTIPVTHRVIAIGPDEGPATAVVTQGDNNRVADEPITLADVEGEVVAKLPLLGEVSRALGAGGGFDVYRYALVLVDLAFVLVYSAVTLVRINARAGRSQGG